MNDPSFDTRPPRPAGEVHLRLADPSWWILPGPANRDGQSRLGDAMLAIAVLACCFALARSSSGLGVAALVLALPALARTYLLQARLRAEGGSPGVGTWVAGFASSLSREVAAIALSAMVYLASIAVGLFLGDRVASSFAPLAVHRRAIASVAGFLLGTGAATLALAVFSIRLLSIRGPLVGPPANPRQARAIDDGPD